MTDQKNTLLAIVLSALVLIGWQIFYGMPQMEKQKQAQQQQQQTPAPTVPAQPAPTPQPGTVPQAPGGPGQTMSREAALALSPRVPIETPSLAGSIALKGGRVDDLSLTKYRETVDPKSPAIVLLAPSGSPHPFYAQFGWTPAAGTSVKLPADDTVWRQEGSGALAVARATIPLVFYDNVEFTRATSRIAMPLNIISAASPPILVGLLVNFGSNALLGLAMLCSCSALVILLWLRRHRPATRPMARN